MLRIDWGLVRSNVRNSRTAVRSAVAWVERKASRQARMYRAISTGAEPSSPERLAADPRVLVPTPLRAVDDQAPLRKGDAGQSPRRDDNLLAVEHERPKVDVAAVQPAVDERRVPAQADGRLGDVAAGVGLDLAC